jgi:hypothetical protein
MGKDRKNSGIEGKISPWEWENGRKNSGMVGKKRKERTGIIKQAMRTSIGFYIHRPSSHFMCTAMVYG